MREALKKIVEYEEKKQKEYKENPIFDNLNHTPYWELYSIPLPWSLVRKLILGGLVEKMGKKYYLLKDRAAVKDLKPV